MPHHARLGGRDATGVDGHLVAVFVAMSWMKAPPTVSPSRRPASA